MLEEARRDRQTGSGRDAYRGMEVEAGKQSQGDRQPNRGKQVGKQNEAKVKEGRQREVGN
jgi:hypothetical protein